MLPPVPAYSAVATAAWRCCPRWYAYRYLEGYTFPLNPPTARHEGERLHRYLEAYGQGLWSAHQPLPTPFLEQQFRHALAYMENLPGEQSWSEWSFYLPRQIDGQKVILNGRIDYLVKHQAHVTLVDWKTGDSQMEHPEYAYQMAFYAWVLSQMPEVLGLTALAAIETHLVFLEPHHVIQKRYEPADFADLEAQFVPAITQMNSQRFRFLPRPVTLQNGTLWCHQCYFKTICPEGMHHENAHVPM